MGKGGGAGRKTQTSSYDSAGGGRSGRFLPIPPDRDLREELGGVIFGATADTIKECLEGLVFGLPERHMTYVEYIEPGCPVFLFNYTDKKLHGIFEATCSGQLNINPHGWTGGTVAKTRYPAQVRVAWYNRCAPLPEAVFKPIIAEKNYYAERRFLFELDREQATQLCALFKGQAGAAPPRAPAPKPAALPPPAAAAAPAPARAPAPAAPQASKPAAAAAPARKPAAAAPKPAPAPQAAAAAQPLALAAPAAAPAASGALSDPVSALARTHAAAAAALAKAEPSVTVAVRAHLEACASVFASLRVEASAAAQARAEAARATAEAAALRAEVAALRARVGTAAAGLAQAAPPSRSRVITLGGHDSVNWLSSVECFDPLAGTWEAVAEMSSRRGYAAAATLSGASGPSVLVVGGGDGSRWFDSADAFDVASGAWRSCAPMSEHRGSLAAVTLRGEVFAFGGGHAGQGNAASTTCVNVTERYDAARDAWVQLAPLSCGRFAASGAALPLGALYAAGGFDGTAYLASAERFDPREGVWCPLPAMQGGRRGSIAIAPAPGSAGEHTLVAAGGFCGDRASGGAAFFDVVEAYDARANAWRPLGKLKRPRGYAAAVAVDGRLIVMGGLHHQAYAETLEEYDAATDAWSTLPLTSGPTCRKRSFIAAAVVPVK